MATSNSKLADHIARLQADSVRTSKGKIRATEALLFWGTFADKNYLSFLKGCVGSHTTFIRLEKITTITQVKMYCDKKGISKVLSTSIPLLEKLLGWSKRKAPSLKSYAGSHFYVDAFKGDGKIEIVFIQPLKQLVTIPYGRFMATRIISKLTKPDSWYEPTTFEWTILTPENENLNYNAFREAFLISIDIETFKENATIRCLSYTAFWYYKDGRVRSLSAVLPLDSIYALSIMRKWNWELKAPKVFQNGKYDIAYLSRYSAPVYNYLYDTATLFHSWYTELPKDLGFLNSFFIREATYWKDLSETTDLHEYYRYNALDTWGTGNTFMAMLLEAPNWAVENYKKEFPTIFPCHLAEMTGIERDMEVLVPARAVIDKEVEVLSGQLDTILGVTGFNVKSPPQKKQLLKILGCSDLKKTDEKDLARARFRHPFNARVIGLVLKIINLRTAREKYLQIGEKAKEFHRQDGTGNRILYALNPHGTDTGRLASREHHFWCGLQIQNITRGPSIKRTFRSDKGFLFGECDLEQAESRDTAYISGDENLIDSVENSPDFHSANASKFFGIAFDQIYDIKTGKVLNELIRQLSKRTNHGATYNMGAKILVETMGEENIAIARKLLGLKSFWTYVQVAEYLLEQFHKTYPGIRETYYTGVIEDVIDTHMLVSSAVHYCTDIDKWKQEFKLAGGGWTRYCFSDPTKSKRALNQYVAHCPQSLNARTLNEAWVAVFHNIAMHPDHGQYFKLLAQIHDSILYQYRIGHEYICDMVKAEMEIPVTIKGYDGVIRTFTVPAENKIGKDHWEVYEEEKEAAA